jgi:hypothetical protein
MTWGIGRRIGRAIVLAGMAVATAMLAFSCSRDELRPSPEVLGRVQQAWHEHPPGMNQPPCEADDCDSGEERTCSDICVTPRTLGQSCTQTDCAWNSWCDGNYEGNSCVNGVCRAPANGGLALWSECNPMDDECPANLFCLDAPTCSPGSANPFCMWGRAHGELCDSDWDSPGCAPCFPGTDCVNGHCRKVCGDPEDCPCGVVGEVACIGEYCYRCAQLGDLCNPERPCCKEEENCGPQGRCCLDLGETCTVPEDCCQNAETCINGVCAECKSINESCSASSDCCDGKCKEGICVECSDDDTKPGQCTVSGQDGECAVGGWECQNHHFVCVGGSPSSEVCDDKDNDCDGDTDEGYVGSACTVTFTGPGGDLWQCQDDFEAPGTFECINGEEVCVSTPGDDYCFQCGGWPVGDCGQCGQQNCSVLLCAPNLDCDGDPPNTFCAIDLQDCSSPMPQCWHPNQIGTCCGDCTP